MNTTSKVLSIAGGVVVVIAVTIGATLGIQELRKPPAPPAPVAPPAPPMAQVVAVNPNFVAVKKTSQACHTKKSVTYSQPSNQPPIAGAVVGGTAGGLAGSLIKGKYHDVAIGAGAVLGAATGVTVQNNRNQPQPQIQETLHCSPKTTTSQVQKGYQVAYVYNGQQSVIVMDNPPPLNAMIPLPGAPVMMAPQQQPMYNTTPANYNTAPAPVYNTAPYNTAPAQQ